MRLGEIFKRKRQAKPVALIPFFNARNKMEKTMTKLNEKLEALYAKRQVLTDQRGGLALETHEGDKTAKDKLGTVLKELSKVNRDIDDAEAASAALNVKLDAEAEKEKQADLELRRSHIAAAHHNYAKAAKRFDGWSAEGSLILADLTSYSEQLVEAGAPPRLLSDLSHEYGRCLASHLPLILRKLRHPFDEQARPLAPLVPDVSQFNRRVR
jgi:hypothetical protein